MKDGLWRRAAKRVALWNFRIEVGLHRGWRRARGERPWPLGGGCQRSGECCEAPSIAAGPLVWNLPRVKQLFLAWHEHVNNSRK